MAGRPKGSKNPNAGRKPGSPNKATVEAREAIAMFVEGNADRLHGWLDAIAEQSPMAAFDRFMSVVEYHVPKLQRTEHIGDEKSPIAYKDVSVKDKVLKAIPTETLDAILAGNNNG